MSRIGRAFRELLRAEPIPERPPETAQQLRLDWFSVSRLYEPVKRIADTLEDMERHSRKRQRRPRLIECEHPELHEDVPA